ncbi:hypothetical protein DENSPDRAFT_836210 [Dentipellis sp. KUC8613]|nr:hypothetical protein DENSPDRAFT_836210 [Dentipellis sp. KUC8613]
MSTSHAIPKYENWMADTRVSFATPNQQQSDRQSSQHMSVSDIFDGRVCFTRPERKR